MICINEIDRWLSLPEAVRNYLILSQDKGILELVEPTKKFLEKREKEELKRWKNDIR